MINADPLDGPPVLQAEQWISDALDALGTHSDEVAATLAAHEAVAGSDFDQDPVCLYLQWHLDPAQLVVRIEDCDVHAVGYAVRNPDGDTWTYASAALPTPVMLFCCRADSGEFPHLVTASLLGGGS